MESESIWLGRFRRPIKIMMMVSLALVALLWVWLIGNRLFAEESIGMHELIRPKGRPLVQVTLIAISAALLLSSIYLSDTRGIIEEKSTGFFDILSLICGRMAMIFVVLIVIVMFYEVVSRYVFARPTLWANELSLWIASFVFLFAGQYAMQQRSHIRIYVIYDIMPRWMQKAADVLSLFLIWAFTFALVWGGFDDAWRRMMRMETFGTAWDPPIPGVVKPAILIIICLVALQALSNLIHDWHKRPEHHSPVDEIDEAEIAKIRETLEK